MVSDISVHCALVSTWLFNIRLVDFPFEHVTQEVVTPVCYFVYN